MCSECAARKQTVNGGSSEHCQDDSTPISGTRLATILGHVVFSQCQLQYTVEDSTSKSRRIVKIWNRLTCRSVNCRDEKIGSESYLGRSVCPCGRGIVHLRPRGVGDLRPNDPGA